MNAAAPDTATRGIIILRPFAFFQLETGQSLALWLTLALLSLGTQIIFCRELAPGEFGTLNTALGVVGLLVVPLAALIQGFATYFAQNHSPERQEHLTALRETAPFITDTLALVWAGLALVIVFIFMPLLDLPRTSLQLFTLLNVFVALGALVSGAVCQNNLCRWARLLIIAALVRLALAGGFAFREPWAESGLVAFLLAGLITLSPALSERTMGRDWRKAVAALNDRKLLIHLGATFSIVLSLFLFSSADRLIAQSWFGSPNADYQGFVKDYVNWPLFDSYQAAGLLGRGLLWGLQPLLLLLFVQRTRLDKTTPTSLLYFWIYLGALFLGATLLGVLAQPLSELFCGAHFPFTAYLVPRFAIAMVPLGLLQGLGMFALASRRHPECFTLGGLSVAYATLLYVVGRQPELLIAYMFGGGMTSLMIVLFIGVVRWGRKPEQILWKHAGTSR